MTGKPTDHHLGVVLRTERIAPHMIRVIVGGDGLRDFAATGHTDQYVKIVFPHEGVEYPKPFDIKQVRQTMPREHWPRLRTYTVRAWDPDARELTLDFVYHGDQGLAGPFAAAAKPGDEVLMLGPNGGYAPDPAADWHLFAGDESALPAIAASLEALPEGARGFAFIEVAGPEEEIKLSSPGHVEITWLYRADRPVGEALVEAVRSFACPAGEVQAFVHGEAGFVKQLRRHLRVGLGIPMGRLSISGYWRAGADDEAWRAVKKDWNKQVEAEEAATLT